MISTITFGNINTPFSKMDLPKCHHKQSDDECAIMEADFQLGWHLKDQMIPKALYFYLGDDHHDLRGVQLEDKLEDHEGEDDMLFTTDDDDGDFDSESDGGDDDDDGVGGCDEVDDGRKYVDFNDGFIDLYTENGGLVKKRVVTEWTRASVIEESNNNNINCGDDDDDADDDHSDEDYEEEDVCDDDEEDDDCDELSRLISSTQID